MSNDRLTFALDRLRQVTAGTKFENELWLVGGYVRDKFLNIPSQDDDVDIVTELDAAELTEYLESKGLSDHTPVTYPRFGTAMVSIDRVNFELVTARRESYSAGSRKPSEVQAATIAEDSRRRDFTINTLLENLHTGETVDPLCVGVADIAAGIIRTPVAAAKTFADDPLRMLRAVRFAARFGFEIEKDTWTAIVENAMVLNDSVSGERIRDEFVKIVSGKTPAVGLSLLLESKLLDQFAPELTSMVGITQNEYHIYPVWEHTIVALTNLVQRHPQSPILLRLAVLLHDCGKPSTKSVGTDGRIHFFTHQDAGARLTRTLLNRLKFSNSDILAVSTLVAQHMRIGEYKADEWTDAAVRRFIRASGPHLDWLFLIHEADVSALGDEHQDMSRAALLKERITLLQSMTDAHAMDSPLSGSEIMEAVGILAGREVGAIKAALTDAVIEGHLAQGDKESAIKLALQLHTLLPK